MNALTRRLAKLEAGSGEGPTMEDWLDLLDDSSLERIVAFEARYRRHLESPTATHLTALEALS